VAGFNRLLLDSFSKIKIFATHFVRVEISREKRYVSFVSRHEPPGGHVSLSLYTPIL
jgi:hypothetical protein